MKGDMNDDHGKKMDEEFLGEIIMYFIYRLACAWCAFFGGSVFFCHMEPSNVFVEYWRSMFTMFKFLSADIADPDPFSSLNHPQYPSIDNDTNVAAPVLPREGKIRQEVRLYSLV